MGGNVRTSKWSGWRDRAVTEFGMYIQCTNSTGTKCAFGLSDRDLPVTRSFVQCRLILAIHWGIFDGPAATARSCVCTAALVGRCALAR